MTRLRFVFAAIAWAEAFLLALFLLVLAEALAANAGDNEANPFKLTFNDEPIGVLPTNWRAFGGDWRIAISGEEQVLQQSSPTLQGLSYAVFLPANYTVTARARFVKAVLPHGFGLIAYWQDQQNHYRLMSYGNQVHLVKVCGGQTITLSWMPYAFELMRWYRIKMSVMNVGKRLSLYGKVWSDGEQEPERWMLVGEDLSPIAMHGWTGIWCAKSACDFDDFEISWGAAQPPVRLRDSFEGYEIGHAPLRWLFIGGSWQIQDSVTKVLSQTRVLEGHTFEHNRYALMIGCSSYTIMVRARATEGADVYGIGLTVHWRDTRSHYDLLSIGATRLALWSHIPDKQKPTSLAESHCYIERGRWHWFKLRVSDDGKSIRLQAKVWRTDQIEPDEWQIEAFDASEGRIASGTFGFISLATTSEFNDLKVVFDQPR